MLFSSLLLLLLPIVSAAAPGKQGRPKCLPSGDEVAINKALTTGGRGTVVTLCQGSTHRLRNPVMFTAPRQTLTTEGDPKGRERAMLIVEGEDQAVAIKADCRQCSFATVQSLIVDGNRPLMLRVPRGGGLLELGNAEGQTVRDCRLFEPRGWTALHFREGDLKQCRKAHVVDNDIGPCGEEWDDEYDGLVESEPINGNPRADGISLACQDSLVERNIVTDATDGAIVLFGSSGSEILNNHVYSRQRVNLGGINLVDFEPWKGDYFGTTVHHNTIHALAGFLRVGIVVGPASWSDDTDTVVHSGSVTDNILEGPRFGYGIVVSSADHFTVLRNVVQSNAEFSGVPSVNCPTAPANGPPTAFLINRGSATGTFQSDFVNGEVQHIICINPPDENGEPYTAWRLRDSPAAVARRTEAEAANAPVSFDSRLAEAVVNYQMELMTAMNGINDKIERHNHPAESEEDGEAALAAQKGKTGIKEVDVLWKRLESLDSGEKRLQREIEAIEREMNHLTTKYKKYTEDNKPILTEVFNGVAKLKAASPGALQGEPKRDAEAAMGFQRDDGGLGPTSVLLGSGAIVMLALTVVKRFRSRTGGTKKGKVF